MTRRSRAREVALQLLFQRDHNSKVERPAVEKFVEDRLREPSVRTFCLALFDGMLGKLDEIDQRLAVAAENWRVSRMTTVDRNVLRLAAYEILFTPDTPPAVAFDEAIELARRFGSADSSAFVNGVLDRLRREAAGESTPADPATAAVEPSPSDQSASDQPTPDEPADKGP